jgi:uncharacterized protein (DUF1501 family)
MKNSRREFLKQSALATAGTVLIPSFLKAFENSSLQLGAKKLVVLQLSGGNDGLNTIVPYRNDLYYQLRPQLGIAANVVLRVSDELGFHPALASLRPMYDKGYLGIFNTVGYPNPDRSHFRSMDIWQTACDSKEYLNTGWLGRYLDASCVNCNAGHQAIEIDDMLSLVLKGENSKGMALKNPEKLYNALHDNLFQKLTENNPTDHTDEPTVSYLYKTLAESVSSSEYIYSKSKVGKSTAAYPDTEFANRLKTIAQLLTSGIDTRVYYASLSGFDTHVRQISTHERLLGIYADAASAFVADLEANGVFDNVLIMTFSEFGRRVSQNASNGTDHGTANNLFLMGKSLKQKGFINDPPDLQKLDQGDLIHTVDFRSVYTTILDTWLGSDAEKVMGGRFERLGFI